MSEADITGGATELADPTKNLKAEFNRKFDNISTELAEQRKLNEAMLAKLTAQTPTPAKAEREPDLSELMYSDPARYSQIIEDRAANRIQNRLDGQQRQANAINAIMQQYPEAADREHPLTKKAVEIYNALPANEQSSPTAYRAAVAEAAQELGIKPASKRPVDDEPSMGPGRPSSSGRRQAKETLDPGTAEFARIMGLNVDDPKVKERLIKRSQRNWNKYQGVS